MSRFVWMYFPAEGAPLTLGEWDNGDGYEGDVVQLAMTDSLEEAQRWARALRDGCIPSADSAPRKPGPP